MEGISIRLDLQAPEVGHVWGSNLSALLCEYSKLGLIPNKSVRKLPTNKKTPFTQDIALLNMENPSKKAITEIGFMPDLRFEQTLIQFAS